MAAVYDKPTKLPLWAMTTAHILEPSAGKKDIGWEFEEPPPSDYENWRTKLVAQWFQWFDERFFDGTYGATPKESTVVQANGVDCIEFTEDGLFILTDQMSLSSDGSFGTVNSGTYAAIPFDILVNPNTGLIYDRVANEFLFKINSTIASWTLTEDGYMRLNNLPGSSDVVAFYMLDRRGGDASGKAWAWEVNGPSGQFKLEQFTQAGVSEGDVVVVDGSTALRSWTFLTSATVGAVLQPKTDYLTDLAGFLGSPSKRWTEAHIASIFEPERPFYYGYIDTPIAFGSGAVTSVMPRTNFFASAGILVNSGTLRMTMPRSEGIYRLDFAFLVKSDVAGVNFTLDLYKNNVVQVASRMQAIDLPNAGEYQIIHATYIVETTALTDYFEVKADHSTGGATVTFDVGSQVTVSCLRRDPT